MMILEFLDGTQLKVRDIFGGPRIVMGVMRDTFRIEVDHDVSTFEELKKLFKDNPNAKILYTYVDDVDEDGNTIQKRVEAGEGYTIFVSITDETRRVNNVPGRIAPEKTEEVYVIQIAQQTYDEYSGTDR